jgi:hypothetical protein
VKAYERLSQPELAVDSDDEGGRWRLVYFDCSSAVLGFFCFVSFVLAI